MKRFLVLLLSMLLLLSLVSGCSGKSEGVPETDTPTTSGESENESTAGTLAGELCEGENFSIIAPAEWKILEFPGIDGYQLYKSSGEVIQVKFEGLNQKDTAALAQAESLAKNYEGTEPVEIEMLGKKFWTTTFVFNDDEQTYYGTMEDGGVTLSIQTSKGNYENNEEYAAILDSIIFK